VVFGSDVFIAVPDGARRAALLEMAAQGPVHRVTLPNGHPGWLVTGPAEARIALTEPRLARGTTGMAFVDELPEAAASLQNHMLNMNPPDHTRLRKLITAAFTRRRVESLAPRIEGVAAELLDAMSPALDRGDAVDLFPSFAYPFPFRVICILLGVPEQDEKELGPPFAALAGGTVSGLQAYGQAANTLLGFLRDLVAAKRRDPGDDLTSALVQVRDGEDRLTEDELTAMLYLLFIAGHETTASLLANAVLALLRNPDQLALVRAQPDLVDATIEETLRYDGVVQGTLTAAATEPFDLGGHTINAGDRVTVSLMAVGLDPALNDDPDRFVITRAADHLAFGHGVHHCVGAPLARLEARIALRALLDRFPVLEIAGESLERVPSLLFNRLAALPVRVPAR
jgi:cytochrome P450